MITVFVTCKNQKEAEKIGLALLKKRLAGCVIVIPKVYSAYFWSPSPAGRTSPRLKRGEPPTSKIEKTTEAVLLVHTLKNKQHAVEREVTKLHSYEVPAIIAFTVSRVNRPYLAWLRKEL